MHSFPPLLQNTIRKTIKEELCGTVSLELFFKTRHENKAAFTPQAKRGQNPIFFFFLPISDHLTPSANRIFFSPTYILVTFQDTFSWDFNYRDENHVGGKKDQISKPFSPAG